MLPFSKSLRNILTVKKDKTSQDWLKEPNPEYAAHDQKQALKIVKNSRVFPVIGKIFSRPYDWGDNVLIPPTLGFEPEKDVPYSEYWIGTHHKAPLQLVLPDGTRLALEEAIKDDPIYVLGQDVAKRFGTLPFLYKLLDAGEMLSIQVHPTQVEAEKGFIRENEAGVPLTDSKRTFKDSNQKFEFCHARDDFWLLHGFRPKDDMKQILTEINEFSFLLPYFNNGDYKKLYKHVMVDMPDAKVNEIIGKLAERILPLYKKKQLSTEHPDYWAAKAMQYMDMKPGTYDRGIFSVYLLNLIHLKKGQSTMQGSGVLHGYLHGPIIEVMTTSDNVVRGGITSKYIDIDELMKMVDFVGKKPKIVEGEKDKNNEEFYNIPTDIFVVSKIDVEKDKSYKTTTYSAEIIMSFGGNATLTIDTQTIKLTKGVTVIVFANTQYEISGSESDVLYKTSVPKK